MRALSEQQLWIRVLACSQIVATAPLLIVVTLLAGAVAFSPASVANCPAPLTLTAFVYGHRV